MILDHTGSRFLRGQLIHGATYMPIYVVFGKIIMFYKIFKKATNFILMIVMDRPSRCRGCPKFCFKFHVDLLVIFGKL